MTAKITALVPARGDSVRLPGKNLRPLGGRSMLAWTAEALVGAGLHDDVLLSTDSEQIAAEGRRLGWSVPFMRPAELARSESSTMDVVWHALDYLRDVRGRDPDQLLLLQPTSPFRGSSLLVDAVNLLRSRPDADAVLAVTKVKVGAQWLLERGEHDILQPLYSGTQTDVYVPTGAVYLVRTNVLRDEGTLVPRRTLPLPHDGLSALDIDTFDDFQLAEAALHWANVAKNA